MLCSPKFQNSQFHLSGWRRVFLCGFPVLNVYGLHLKAYIDVG